MFVCLFVWLLVIVLSHATQNALFSCFRQRQSDRRTIIVRQMYSPIVRRQCTYMYSTTLPCIDPNSITIQKNPPLLFFRIFPKMTINNDKQGSHFGNERTNDCLTHFTNWVIGPQNGGEGTRTRPLSGVYTSNLFNDLDFYLGQILSLYEAK